MLGGKQILGSGSVAGQPGRFFGDVPEERLLLCAKMTTVQGVRGAQGSLHTAVVFDSGYGPPKVVVELENEGCITQRGAEP